MATNRRTKAPQPSATGQIRPSKLKFDPTTVGSTGLRQWGGIIDEEFMKELRGRRAAYTFREMSDNDPVVGAIVYAITMLMRETPWTITAVDESDEANDAKEFVDNVFDEMKSPISDIIDEVCSMFIYGYAPMEITWRKRKDGNIGLESIELRAQPTVYRWQIDIDDGSIDGLWQQPWSGPLVFIPIEKLLLFRTTVTRNNPEGRSTLRTAYRPWFYKKRIEEIEAVGIERDLAGMPVARIPGFYFSADADPDQKATLARYNLMVRNIKMDKMQGVVLPSDTDAKGKLLYDFELMHAGGTRSIDTTKIIDRYDRQIATSVLADFIFLGQSSRGGSYALSSDKTAMFSSAIAGFSKGIAAVFNRHLLPRLWTLNAFDPALMPEMKAGDIEDQNLQQLGAFITALAGAGMALFPDRELENHLRSEAGLPEAPEIDEDGVDMDTPNPVPIVGPAAAKAVQQAAPPALKPGEEINPPADGPQSSPQQLPTQTSSGVSGVGKPRKTAGAQSRSGAKSPRKQ